MHIWSASNSHLIIITIAASWVYEASQVRSTGETQLLRTATHHPPPPQPQAGSSKQRGCISQIFRQRNRGSEKRRGLLVHSIPRIQIQRFNSKQLCYFPSSPGQLLKEPLKSLLFNQSVYTVELKGCPGVHWLFGLWDFSIMSNAFPHLPLYFSFPWRIMPSCLYLYLSSKLICNYFLHSLPKGWILFSPQVYPGSQVLWGQNKFFMRLFLVQLHWGILVYQKNCIC